MMQASDSHSAQQHYLLGAELAEAGEYNRAVEEMTRAVELEPQLHTARLQLGLLHLTMGQREAALEQWARLRQTPVSGIRCFAEGLEALSRDDFARCVTALEQGITLNTTNPPLNDDMRMIIERIRAGVTTQAQQPADGEAAAVVRTDFSLYGRND
jgi:tetratricopeptide (TPR) repeat protein